MVSNNGNGEALIPDDLERGLGIEHDGDTAAPGFDADTQVERGLGPGPEDDPDLLLPMLDEVGSRLDISVVNRAMVQPGHRDVGVEDCSVRIVSASGTTNRFGNTRIDLSSLADGAHPLRVTAPDMTEDPPGPGTPADTSKERVWRPFTGTVTVQGGRFVDAEPKRHVAIVNDRLRIQLEPAFVRSDFFRRRANKPDMIVIHHTAGTSVRGDLRHLAFTRHASVHYLVTPDGEVIKIVDDAHTAHHAGASFWQGVEGMNSRSIGIEITHATGEYPQVQVDAVIELVKRIHAAFPNIPAGRVIAHSDIAITRRQNRPPTRHGRKSTDPGSAFPWERIEALGLGLQIANGVVDTDMYGGFFREVPNGSLRRGDRDDRQRYGGVHRPNMSGIVRNIQTELARIGYLTRPVDGHYGGITAFAVQMFQQPMFSGSRRKPGVENSGNGNLDRETAEMIKRVLGETQQPPVG